MVRVGNYVKFKKVYSKKKKVLGKVKDIEYNIVVVKRPNGKVIRYQDFALTKTKRPRKLR